MMGFVSVLSRPFSSAWSAASAVLGIGSALKSIYDKGTSKQVLDRDVADTNRKKYVFMAFVVMVGLKEAFLHRLPSWPSALV